MTDRALSEEAMLASLHDISLPGHAAGGLPAEIAVTVGLAGAAALLVASFLRLFSQRLRQQAPPSLKDHLARVQEFPEDRRRLALLHLLRQYAPDRYGQVARDLYHPNADVTVQGLQAELDRLV